MGGISIVHVGSNVRVDCGGPASKLWSSAHVTARAAKRPRAWNTCERTFNFEDDRPDGPNGSSSLLFLVLRRMLRSLDFPFLALDLLPKRDRFVDAASRGFFLRVNFARYIDLFFWF